MTLSVKWYTMNFNSLSINESRARETVDIIELIQKSLQPKEWYKRLDDPTQGQILEHFNNIANKLCSMFKYHGDQHGTYQAFLDFLRFIEIEVGSMDSTDQRVEKYVVEISNKRELPSIIRHSLLKSCMYSNSLIPQKQTEFEKLCTRAFADIHTELNKLNAESLSKVIQAHEKIEDLLLGQQRAQVVRYTFADKVNLIFAAIYNRLKENSEASNLEEVIDWVLDDRNRHQLQQMVNEFSFRLSASNLARFIKENVPSYIVSQLRNRTSGQTVGREK